ncbi:nuclear transport factor 2 family protein [Nocardia huaxiensis]|uniref:Nuclear transport factor 2 family protein n=1 Tax=Nocardia huaxiensis TaxID=2755382 RepID=A0A7D6ZK66_9NOCA|nr:nuclear transport factor 2 family protein [Nocardia huaxiensis]QLY32667.1 nuclear transport factor 2 family protein [Nocardia huaxiensis]UFS93600.1 nuclear transport factor 2 family protein [Nocardia huaxiensis]
MNANFRPSNADIVGTLYRAFGTGDIAYILDQLSDDVAWDADWNSNSAQLAGVAHMAARKGPAEVAEFFALLADWTFHEFTVLDVIGTDGQVAAEIRVDVTLPGGTRITDDELHLWSFDADGKVTRFRHYADTAKHITAAVGG